MDARCHAVVMTVENQKETKKKSVTAGLYEDPDRLVVVKIGAMIGARVGDRGDATLPPRYRCAYGRGEAGPARGQGPRG